MSVQVDTGNKKEPDHVAKEENQEVTKSGLYSYLLPEDADVGHERHVTFASLWSGFKQHTTAHGIPHVDHSHGRSALIFDEIVIRRSVILPWQLSWYHPSYQILIHC